MDNIILINCDDLGYGDLGCYGSNVNNTPTIDQMCSLGMKCTDFYAASPVCTPSRGAMMTGCYPPRIGFTEFGPEKAGVLRPGHPEGLNPNEITIAKLLKKAGYTTALIGKWHCGDQRDFLPLQHGFDYYYGLPFSNDMGRQRQDGTDRPPLPLLYGNEVIEQQPDQASLTSRYVEKSILFLRRNKDRPFFLYFAHMHTHLPLYAPDVFNKMSHNGDYGACVQEIDWSLNVILHELKELGIEEKTLIIFTSDNGSRADHGASNYPLRGNKAGTYEGGIRVPCIFYKPNSVMPKSEYKGIISSIDLYASIASYVGIDLPKSLKIDSIDHSELWRGKTKVSNARDTFYYYLRADLEAIRYRNWKLIVSHAGEPCKELFDLENDLSEENNVYDENPQLVKKLLQKIEEQRIDTGDARLQISGKGVRPIGKVENPVKLTEYNENHPYMILMYDKEDRG